MRIDRADIMAAFDQLHAVDRTPLRSLEIIDEDLNIVQIPEECYREWEFIGLSNSYFIKEKYWEEWQTKQANPALLQEVE